MRKEIVTILDKHVMSYYTGKGYYKLIRELNKLINLIEKTAYDSGYKNCHFNNFNSKDDVIGI